MNAREDAVIINSLVRQAPISAQEVMGGNGLNAVLRTSGLERLPGKNTRSSKHIVWQKAIHIAGSR